VIGVSRNGEYKRLVDRRDFIKTSLGGMLLALGTAGGVAGWSAFKRSRRWIVGGGRYARNGKTHHLLAMFDPSRGQARYIELGFLPHGLIFDPLNTSRGFLFEKIGLGACEIDLGTGEIVRSIAPLDGYQFYGHGAFSADGKHFYATETRLSDQAGALVIRDSQTALIVGEFPTYGENPHECQMIDQGRTLVVTNGGGQVGSEQNANVAYIDVESRKLQRRLMVPVQEWNAGHLAPFNDSSAGGIVVVSAPRRGLPEESLGGISVLGGDGLLRPVRGPEDVLRRLQGEALSVCIHRESGTFGVTHPLGNLVTFWSLEDRTFLSALPVERPRGLTLTSDHNAFLVSYGNNASLAQIDPNRRMILEDTRISNTGLAGSHLFHWFG